MRAYVVSFLMGVGAVVIVLDVYLWWATRTLARSMRGVTRAMKIHIAISRTLMRLRSPSVLWGTVLTGFYGRITRATETPRFQAQARKAYTDTPDSGAARYGHPEASEYSPAMSLILGNAVANVLDLGPMPRVGPVPRGSERETERCGVVAVTGPEHLGECPEHDYRQPDNVRDLGHLTDSELLEHEATTPIDTDPMGDRTPLVSPTTTRHPDHPDHLGAR